MKRVLTWGGAAFLVFMIATRPQESAGAVGKALGFIGDVAQGFASFLTGVVS